MNILIVTDAWHPQINGVVRTYEHLVPELERMGHIVRVVGPSDFPHSFPMPGYGEIRLTLFPGTRLKNIIDGFAPDLLHIGTEGPLGLAARRIALQRGFSFTTCYHTQFPEYAAKRAKRSLPFLENAVRDIAVAFIRWFHAPSSCVFAATKTSQAQLQGWNFKAPIRIMTRGVDFSSLFPPTGKITHDRPVALYVGRVAIEKNIEAFLDMNWDGDKIIVGGGPDLPMLMHRYPETVFKGPLTGDALRDAYQQADVFVFPSRTDTFGMVLIEAMACGLPIAAYPVCGPLDIVTQDFLGALGDDLSLAAVKALKTGTAAQRSEHARAFYSWHVAAKQFLQIETSDPAGMPLSERKEHHETV